MWKPDYVLSDIICRMREMIDEPDKLPDNHSFLLDTHSLL
jgi:hypothetical protein